MPETLVAVVEIPKGSSNKYEWDDALGAIKLERLLARPRRRTTRSSEHA
jgi:inorganic pyrophosphatase